MKANANKRKIFDAVDLLTEDTSAQTTAVKAENGIEQIAIDSIKAFHIIRSIYTRENALMIWWRVFVSMVF